MAKKYSGRSGSYNNSAGARVSNDIRTDLYDRTTVRTGVKTRTVYAHPPQRNGGQSVSGSRVHGSSTNTNAYARPRVRKGR